MLGSVKREKEEIKIKQKFGGGFCDKSPKGVDQTRSDQCPIRKKIDTQSHEGKKQKKNRNRYYFLSIDVGPFSF